MNNGILTQPQTPIAMPYGLLGSAAQTAATYPLFSIRRTPDAIPGLLAWYDASDMQSMRENSNGTNAVASDSAAVGCWLDKGPFGYHMTQATNSRRPLLRLFRQNSLPALVFDGISSYLLNSTAFMQGLFPSIFAVAQRTSDNTIAGNQVAGVLGMGRAGASGESACNVTLRNSYLNPANAVVLSVGASSGTNRRNGTTSLLTGNAPTPFLVMAGFNYTVAARTQYTTEGVTIGAVRDSGGTAGSTGANNFYLNGMISEIIVYNRNVSEGEARAIEAYLLSKWGIA